MNGFSECLNEQQFKQKYIRDVLQKADNKVFCIETEETVKGFPDVMVLTFSEGVTYAKFYEFKFTNNSKIKFQPTQPSFYRNNPAMNTRVIAYDKKTDTVHDFAVRQMFWEDSKYKLNEKAEVVL